MHCSQSSKRHGKFLRSTGNAIAADPCLVSNCLLCAGAIAACAAPAVGIIAEQVFGFIPPDKATQTDDDHPVQVCHCKCLGL